MTTNPITEQDIVDIICGDYQTPEETAPAIKRLIDGPPAPPEPTPLSTDYRYITDQVGLFLEGAARAVRNATTFEDLDEQIDLLEIHIGTLHAVRGKGGAKYYSRGPARVVSSSYGRR